MAGFILGSGDWTAYRKLPGKVNEVDFHYDQDRGDHHGFGSGRRRDEDDIAMAPYHERMNEGRERTLQALKDAYADPGVSYVLFTHGWTTSRIGKTTYRSVVRGVMRSKEATPYIDRRQSIQHDGVFVAKIRDRK